MPFGKIMFNDKQNTKDAKNMSEKIIQLNEARIKDELKELVRSSVEETLNGLLDKEAEELVNAEKYERSAERQGYRAGHYARNFTNTPDADVLNAKINEDITQYIRPMYEKFMENDFSSVKKQGPDQISNILINYETYEYNNVFALVIEERYGFAEAGASYKCNVYYYDSKAKKMIDAETYAKLMGYTKEDIILAENNDPDPLVSR